MYVRRAPGRSHIAQDIEPGQEVRVRADGVSEVVVVVQFPIRAAVEIDAAGVEALVVEPRTGFGPPIVARILLNGEHSGILLHVVRDDGHHARARRVGVLDIGIEQPRLGGPMVGIGLLPTAVGLKTLQLEIEGGHVRAEIAALVEFSAVVVLIGRLPFEMPARGEGVARVEFGHLVHHFLVRVVDLARPRVELCGTSQADALSQELFVAHLCAEEHADAGGKQAVVPVGFEAVALPAEGHGAVGFAHAGVVEQIVGSGAVAPVEVGAL